MYTVARGNSTQRTLEILARRDTSRFISQSGKFGSDSLIGFRNEIDAHSGRIDAHSGGLRLYRQIAEVKNVEKLTQGVSGLDVTDGLRNH